MAPHSERNPFVILRKITEGLSARSLSLLVASPGCRVLDLEPNPRLTPFGGTHWIREIYLRQRLMGPIIPSAQPPSRGLFLSPGSHGSDWEVQDRRGRTQSPHCACGRAGISTGSDRCGYTGEWHHVVVRHRHGAQQTGRAHGNRPRNMGAGAGPPHDGASTARRCVRQLWPHSLTCGPRRIRICATGVLECVLASTAHAAKSVRVVRSPADIDQQATASCNWRTLRDLVAWRCRPTHLLLQRKVTATASSQASAPSPHSFLFICIPGLLKSKICARGLATPQ